MTTMYIRKSRLSLHQQSEMIEHFVAGCTARTASEVFGIEANTAIRFFTHLRQLIANKLPSYQLCGVGEADESYIGSTHKGKHGRGDSGKVGLLGFLKRGGNVCAAIISSTRTETLLRIIQEKVELDSIAYTNMFRAHNVLDISEFHHHRINQSKLFANKQIHINGIENLWC